MWGPGGMACSDAEPGARGALAGLAGANARAAAEHSPMLWTELATGAAAARANGNSAAYFTEVAWHGRCMRELHRARPMRERCMRRREELAAAGYKRSADVFGALGVISTGHWEFNATQADRFAALYSREASRGRAAAERAAVAARTQRARKHSILFQRELARQAYIHEICSW